MSNRNSQSPASEWWQNPWKVSFSAFMSIVTLFGIGYGVAVHFCNQDFKIEKIELKQEYNEKVQSVINDCRDGKMKEYDENIHEIKETVNSLKKVKR